MEPLEKLESLIREAQNTRLEWSLASSSGDPLVDLEQLIKGKIPDSPKSKKAASGPKGNAESSGSSPSQTGPGRVDPVGGLLAQRLRERPLPGEARLQLMEEVVPLIEKGSATREELLALFDLILFER